MIFVDSNVFIYAVGRPHPLREQAGTFLERSLVDRTPLACSAEVLQELMHVYLSVRRPAELERAWALAESLTTVWSVEHDDLRDARRLAPRYPHLDARDLVHLACCRRRRATGLHTYDRALAAAWAAA
jgi:uncharacterized protein